MKCFLFIIILFSIGRFIDTQGEDDADSNFSGAEVFYEEKITKYDPLEHSEESTYDDKYDSKDDENASEDESSEQEKRDKKKETSLAGVRKRQEFQAELNRFGKELRLGDSADLIGQNQHVEQSQQYGDLGRRSVAQDLKNIGAENADLTPEKAPPELVLLVAKESALLRAGKDTDLGSDFDQKKLLRSGDYWNGVWKEEVKPKSAMRSASQKKKLGSIKAKIYPGTEFYKVVSRMKKISPQLLYIINKKQP